MVELDTFRISGYATGAQLSQSCSSAPTGPQVLLEAREGVFSGNPALQSDVAGFDLSTALERVLYSGPVILRK